MQWVFVNDRLKISKKIVNIKYTKYSQRKNTKEKID